MRNGFLGSVAAMLAGTGFALGQAGPGLSARVPPPDQMSKPATSTGTSPSEGGTGAGTGTDTTKESSKPADQTKSTAGLPGDWANAAGEDSCGHFKTTAEFLFYFTKPGRDLPPLVQAGNVGPTGTIIPAQGQGNPDLAGTTGAEFSYGFFTGGRIAGAYEWCDCESCGIEASLFFLPKISTDFTVGSEFVTRPFSDAVTGLETGLIVAFPTLSTGSVHIVANTQVWGAEVNAYKNIIDDPIVAGIRLAVLAGFRYMEVDEDLSVQSITSFNQNLVNFPTFTSFSGNTIQVNDKFLTRNQFYGGQVGVNIRAFGDLGNFDFIVKLGLGTNDEEINITGNQVRTTPAGITTVSNGGLLALPSNIGIFKKDQFTIIPEVDLNWSIPLYHNLSLNLGYDFIYFNRMVRAADQIDRDINPFLIPNFGTSFTVNPLGRPKVPFFQSAYYTHGFNVGFEFVW
jgi:Putative beta barrel porin-7 (BBP7)